MKTDEQIHDELMKLIENLDDDIFWKWVISWYDVNDIIDTAKNWDTPVQAEAIKEIKKLMKEKK